MRLFAALLAAALLAGCGSDTPTVNARGELVVDRTPIEFPRTFVGFPTTADLVVRNTGRTRLSMELAISGPYSMENGRPSIPGGGNVGLPVTFLPGRAGSHPGILHVTIAGETLEIPLLGVAEQPPPCAASGPCFKAEFDPATGICTETMLPDNADCVSGNKCQVDEVCQAGVCVGAARDCGDDDVCTADACDPATGCVNVDTSSSCPQPEDPCLEAFCHPESGCGVGAAPSWITPCGPADCVSADVCIDGACETVDVPDGTECVDECGLGKCDDGECERPDGDRLRQLWSYQPPAGNTITFGGVSDGAGQLYWTETSDVGTTALVSATPGGVIRYTKPLFVPGAFGARGLAIEDGMLILGFEDKPAVQAFLPADGSSVWTNNLTDVVRAEVDGCPCTATAGTITRSERGRAAWSANVAPVVGGVPRAFVAMLRTGSGETAWAHALDGALAAPPIADEVGNLYLLLLGTGADPQAASLVSLDPAGEERWRVPATPEAMPLAVWNGEVQQAIDALLATADGGSVRRLDYDQPNVSVPLHGTDGSFAFTRTAQGNVIARSFAPDGDPLSSAPLFDPLVLGRAVPPLWSEAMLTRNATALLSTSVPQLDGTYLPLLVEVEPDGNVKRQCTLGVAAAVTGPFSLRGGKWTVHAAGDAFNGLRSYELPLADPAARGWVGPLGNPAGGGRPQ